MLPVLGIDVAKKKLDVVLLVGGRPRAHQVDNTPPGFQKLLSWLRGQKVKQVHACLEATGSYGDALVYALHDAGHVVSVVNPKAIHHFAQAKMRRMKTDQVDAALIAEFCQKEGPRAWSPPAPAVRQLQELTRRRDALVETRQEEGQRLQVARGAAVADSIQRHLTFLDEAIADVDRQIHDLIDQDPDLRARRELLTSIPGVAETTAAIVLSELPPDLATAREAAAYAGLTPTQKTSGTSVHTKPRLSKVGNARLRKALFMPAANARRFNRPIRVFCDRLVDKGLHKMAIRGAAMRKLLHMIFGILKHQCPFDPNWAPAT